MLNVERVLQLSSPIFLICFTKLSSTADSISPPKVILDESRLPDVVVLESRWTQLSYGETNGTRALL